MPQNLGLHSHDVLLEVNDLRVAYGRVRAVRGVSFCLAPGETLGVVGESGSGKSSIALALLGLLSETAEVTGSARFQGRELVGARGQDLDHVRGREMGIVFQNPLSSLNPVLRVGQQVAEAVRRNERLGKAGARRRAVELLSWVGIPDPSHRVDAFPHELSGGMRQRVMIAIALACGPSVLVADEPTTALDVTVQAQILELLHRLQAESGLGIILITHDLAIVAGLAQRVLVMYAGRIVETGAVDSVFTHALHPYTRALLHARPRLDDIHDHPLRVIPGAPPDLDEEIEGCPFFPRCDRSVERCTTELPQLVMLPSGSGSAARCVNPVVDANLRETLRRL